MSIYNSIKSKIPDKLRFNIKAYFLAHRNYLLLQELNWADVFHDSIRGKDFLEKLPLNIGRMAGGYCLFYLLNRILSDCRPKKILELGLGESSKFISAYLNHQLTDSVHLIIEDNESWIKNFKGNFKLSNRSQILHTGLKDFVKHGFETKCYDGLDEIENQKFDLYIIDGPVGCDRYSRQNALDFVNVFQPNDNFIIIFDDSNRKGEKDTVNELLDTLTKRGIKFYTNELVGVKNVTVIVTELYRFIASV